MKNPQIKFLFEPKSIAVIGASSSSDKIGYKIVENIVSGGYKGKLYPINPKGGEILGLPIYKNLLDIGGEVDVAVLVIPAKMVFSSVEECAKKGVKFLSIITSGFSEVGNIEGEKQIVNFAREHGMRVLGPNIFGIYSANASLNATFGPKDIVKGNVAIITQSGALGIAMIGKTAVENIGLSAIISIGNKSDLSESDLLEYLVEDKETKIIMMYIEGVSRGDELVESLKKVSKKKPVIVIKSGRSKRGAMAAASHTGSLAGADEVFDAIMRQCGVFRAESLNEAFNWAKFLANSPPPVNENTVIITNGGGIGVMATDACEKYGVKLYDDTHDLKKIFSPVTPDFGSTKNPIDLTGQATSAFYDSAMTTALNNPHIGSVISLYCETAMFDVENLSPATESIYKKFKEGKKPVVFSLLGGGKVDSSITALNKKDVPVFEDVYEAVSCLGKMYSCYRRSKLEEEVIKDIPIDVEEINRIVKKAREDKRSFLLAHEGQAVMKCAGITIPKSHIAHNIDDAVKFAEGIGYPVVMKVVSRDILHKSDCGGVALGLENKNEVIDAYQAIMHNCRQHEPKAYIEGMEVSEMVKKGTEMIVGARRDRSFGPVVMCGLGGVYVEVMKDVSFRAFPIGRNEAYAMIQDVKSHPLLLGVRGESRKDIEGVIDTILKLGTIICKCREITDIEVNPLVAYDLGEGVKAVDVRVLIKKL